MRAVRKLSVRNHSVFQKRQSYAAVQAVSTFIHVIIQQAELTDCCWLSSAAGKGGVEMQVCNL